MVVRNRFLYLNGTSSVIAYTVDSTTGTFTWVGDYSLSSANFEGMVASADGQYLFVAGTTSISAFQIGATGALTAVAGSPFPTSTYAPLRLSSAGPFVLAGGSSAVLTLQSAAGVLAAPQVRATAAAVEDFVGSADGRHAYAADAAGHVTAFTVDPASGAMTAMAGTHNADATTAVFGAVLHPGGKFLYVVNHGGTVTRFDISASDGSLGPDQRGHRPWRHRGLRARLHGPGGPVPLPHQ